jgi:hypothetical protein
MKRCVTRTALTETPNARYGIKHENCFKERTNGSVGKVRSNTVHLLNSEWRTAMGMRKIRKNLYILNTIRYQQSWRKLTIRCAIQELYQDLFGQIHFTPPPPPVVERGGGQVFVVKRTISTNLI